MTLRDRILAAPDKIAAARVALDEAVRAGENDTFAWQSNRPTKEALHSQWTWRNDRIRALRDSLGE
jgi:hypothetical protein